MFDISVLNLRKQSKTNSMKTAEETLKQYNRIMNEVYRKLNKMNLDKVPNDNPDRMRLAMRTNTIFKAMVKCIDKHVGKGYVMAVSDMTRGLDNRFTCGLKYE